MYRVILVDDEPLILAGIASLITREDYDCTIVGKATNGPSAYDMILAEQPDLVITDIRMPVLNGLELVEKCQASGCRFSFIVLTNLEDFQLARQAIVLGACDYLVKLNLTPEELSTALNRAKEDYNIRFAQRKEAVQPQISPFSMRDIISYYFRQVLIIGDTEAAVPQGAEALYVNPFVVAFSIRQDNIHFHPELEMESLKQNAPNILTILKGLGERFFPQQTFLQYNRNTFLLVGSIKDTASFAAQVSSFCQKAATALKTYFEFASVFGVSTIGNRRGILEVPLLFSEAMTALDYYYYDSRSSVVFYEGQHIHESSAGNFNINFLKKDLSVSIQQSDSDRLREIFDQIIQLFKQNSPAKRPAVSACINIYTFLYSFFEDEKNSYQDIFPYTLNIAEYLEHFTSLKDILEWLESFRDKLCKLLDDRKNTRSDKLVDQAARYIDEHYQEKLTLADIARELNISAGHLSITFKKYTGTTVSDYIANVKIHHAKELIDTHKYLMYEISDILGFDNPYYFSKVFKKVTGISPREHEKRNL